MARTKHKTEYGDFQTPRGLAQRVCALLAEQGLEPAALLEPTCGLGNFLFAGLDQFKNVRKAFGADINPEYVAQAEQALSQRQDAAKVKLVQASFFVTDWQAVLGELPDPVLVLGNPPWVTNAGLGVLESQNLPNKSNFQKYNGLDAMTGKSNFDISEWMLIRLLESMNGRTGALAMLCKSSTARKTLTYAWKKNIALEQTAIYGIDADLHFDAAVDAVLLVSRFRPGAHDQRAKVYDRLEPVNEQKLIGLEDDMLLGDVVAYSRWKHLCGDNTLKWRSGIKHDCAQVMELRPEGCKYRNGFDQLVELEETFLYPMLKSSDVAKGCQAERHRVMLVPQSAVGDDTRRIEKAAPKTWTYLQTHGDRLKKRASSIYRNRPEFSVFGVGDYSFASWKVAISGFYKNLRFSVVGPTGGKAVVFDDTAYFLPCSSEEQANYLTTLLNSYEAQAFYSTFIFWDSKRPITAELLGRLGLRRLARELGSEERFVAYFGGPEILNKDGRGRKRKESKDQLALWSK